MGCRSVGDKLGNEIAGLFVNGIIAAVLKNWLYFLFIGACVLLMGLITILRDLKLFSAGLSEIDRMSGQDFEVAWPKCFETSVAKSTTHHNRGATVEPT